MATDIFLRAARASDQGTIRDLVRRAGINPLGLDWPRFIVAQGREGVVGVVQVKPHRDGSHELASLAVEPAYRGRGIGAALVQALMAREAGPLYLMCAAPMQSYYPQFGFQAIGPAEMPPYFRRIVRLASLFNPIFRTGLVVMKRPADPQPAAVPHDRPEKGAHHERR